jgi:D-tyrosyl-tRNA(Tyr) deacylase
MRVVIQRVAHASVTIDGVVKSAIGQGLLVLVGFEAADTAEDVAWTTRKLLGLRIFDDEAGVMNRSVLDVGGGVLIVSQFTLHAMTAKGNRPSYIRAAGHDVAIPLYKQFLASVSAGLGKEVGSGRFGADMKVELLNDGPVTICMDSKNKE